MSTTLPPVLDAWRMVSSCRYFEGRLPLAGFSRLRGSLVDVEGECCYKLEFGRDAMNQAFVAVWVEAKLPLLCQRSLERYLHPVVVEQKLGLITDEA